MNQTQKKDNGIISKPSKTRVSEGNVALLSYNKTAAVVFIFLALLGLGIIIYNCLVWKFHNYQNLSLPYASGVNIVAWWAEFLFLTIIMLTVFCIWLLFAGIARLSGNQKISKIIFNPYLFLFIAIFETIVPIVFTLGEMTNVVRSINGESVNVFGWYGNYPHSWYSMIATLIVHYGYSVLALVLWAKSRITQKLSIKKCKWIYLFLLIYFVVVLILGKFAFYIEWYPYFILNNITLWRVLFGSSEIIVWLSYLLMAVVNLIILSLIFLINWIYIKKKNRQLVAESEG